MYDKYDQYVDRIFNWSVYRNGPAIHRANMCGELPEMRKLAKAFDNPQDTLKVIHVAGTNGKGSVSMKVARSLESMGIKTGLFTSPHIISFRERVQVNS